MPKTLALALTSLLDETELFSREEWADFLGVSRDVLSRWATGEDVPPADRLRMIEEVIESNGNANEGPLVAFQGLKNQPAVEITPHEIGRTLDDYLMGPLVETFQRVLKTVPPRNRAEALLAAGRVCRRQRQRAAQADETSYLGEAGEPLNLRGISRDQEVTFMTSRLEDETRVVSIACSDHIIALSREGVVDLRKFLDVWLSQQACVSCGGYENDDGSRVTWKCHSCGGFVCRECTLTIPNSVPREYYYQTLCSKRCWEAAGSPEK